MRDNVRNKHLFYEDQKTDAVNTTYQLKIVENVILNNTSALMLTSIGSLIK